VQRVKSGSYKGSPGTKGAQRVSLDCRKVVWSLAQLVQSKGHPRGGISPKGSSIESGTEVAFALV